MSVCVCQTYRTHYSEMFCISNPIPENGHLGAQFIKFSILEKDAHRDLLAHEKLILIYLYRVTIAHIK